MPNENKENESKEMLNENKENESKEKDHSGLADQLVRLFGPDPNETPETNTMMLEALKGWRAKASDPRQTPSSRLRKILVEQADAALKRVQEMAAHSPRPKSSESPDQT